MEHKKQQQILNGDGQGLGLKNVIAKVKMLSDGEIYIDSAVNEGTNIKIIIPEVKQNEGYIS